MYEATQKHLSDLEQSLAARLENISNDLTSQHSADSAEQATERENEDVLRNLQEETRRELQQVRAALKRIASGEYGICSQCGGPIGEARLAALPYATRCIHCAD